MHVHNQRVVWGQGFKGLRSSRGPNVPSTWKNGCILWKFACHFLTKSVNLINRNVKVDSIGKIKVWRTHQVTSRSEKVWSTERQKNYIFQEVGQHLEIKISLVSLGLWYSYPDIIFSTVFIIRMIFKYFLRFLQLSTALTVSFNIAHSGLSCLHLAGPDTTCWAQPSWSCRLTRLFISVLILPDLIILKLSHLYSLSHSNRNQREEARSTETSRSTEVGIWIYSKTGFTCLCFIITSRLSVFKKISKTFIL